LSHRLKVKQTDGLTDGPEETSNERSFKATHASSNLKNTTTGASTSVPSVNAIRLGFLKQCNKNNQTNPGGISMHKFINSKGKSLASQSNLNRFASHQNLCFNSNTNDYSVQMVVSTTKASTEHRGIIRASDSPVPLIPMNSVQNNFKAVRKGTTPAETKIQAELREMKQREEELR